MGELTTLARASPRTTSLRATVPANIIRQFKLEEHDKLDWTLDVKDGKMIIIVTPIKEGENRE